MIKIISFFLFVSCWLVACTPSKELVDREVPKLNSTLTEKENIAFGQAFMDGVKAKILEDYEEAEKQFKKALSIDPEHAAANYELGLVYNKQEQQELAFQQFKMASEAEPQNYWYKLSYVSFLDNLQNKKPAIEVYRELIALKPAQIELKYQLSRLLYEEGEIEESIGYLNEIEQEIGMSEEISKLKQSIYLSQNEVEKAAAEVRKLMEAFPGEIKYYGRLADIYQANNKQEKAFEVYQEMARIAPNDYRVQFSLAEYHRAEGNNEEYLRSITQAFENPQMNIDDKVKYVLSFYRVNSKNQERKSEGIQLCKAIVKAHGDNAKSHALLADFLYFDNQTELAKEHYMKTIALDSSRFPVWNQLLVILSERNDRKALLDYGSRAVSLFPNQPTVYLLYGLGLAQDDQHEEAIQYLEIGKDLVIDNDLLKSQICASMGDSYHSLEQHEQSDQHYEKALKLDPNNVYVLNNYSYYLSLRGENLEKAKEMSWKSNQLAPGQASFLDTYAWILFQLEEYEKAEEWINKALKSDGEKSPVLLEHKGDILQKLGKTKQAIDYWQKALDQGGEAEELLKKLQEHRLP
jgi:tetratricopeptide (TPR) repeat protein